MTKIFSKAGKRSKSWRLPPAAFYFITLFILLPNCNRNTGEHDNTIVYWSANNQYEQNLAKAVVALHPDMPVFWYH